MNKLNVIFFLIFFNFGYLNINQATNYKIIVNINLKYTDTSNTITVAAFTEIKYQAESAIKTLESVLNSITFNDNTPSELAGYIKNSFTPDERSRVFLNDKIIVESDIDPKFILGKNKDLAVEKYLNDLALSYEKTGDFSIKFSNITSSNVKKTDHIYIRVRYDESFGSKYKPDGSIYPMRQREATIKMIPVGKKKWSAFIEKIVFYDPNSPIESKDHDMQIISSDELDDASSTATDEEIQKAIIAKKIEINEIKTQYVKNGNSFFLLDQYEDALASYEKAIELVKFDPNIDKKIRDTKRLIGINTFENWKSKGDKANIERDFISALYDFNKAIRIKNSESVNLHRIIDTLNRIIQVISKPDNLFKAGDYDGAIDECDKVLFKIDSLRKREFPELYLIKGLAYQKKAEIKADSNLFNKALENFDIAIDLFPNFKRALINRANFYEKIKINIGLAINDYESLIRNEVDESFDKPLYHISLGKLRAKVHNDQWPKSSITDYETAINLINSLQVNKPIIINSNHTIVEDTILNRYAAESYLLKGEIEYEAKRNKEALNSFNKVINYFESDLTGSTLNNAYFFRGLNFINLGELDKASNDLGIAKQGLINTSWEEWNRVDSLLSYAYSKDGLKFKQKEIKLGYNDLKNEYERAEKQFDQAIQVFKFNANAYYGKAEIRFAAGDYYYENYGLENTNTQQKYDEAIDFYNKSLVYNNNFSEAYFKIGLIQQKRKEYNAAIKSITNAIKFDPKNIHFLIERAKTYLNQFEYANSLNDFSLALELLSDTIKDSKYYGKTPIDSKKSLYENLSTTFELTWKNLFLNEDIADKLILDSTFRLKVNTNSGKNSFDYYRKGLLYFKSGIEFQKAVNEFETCAKSGTESLDSSFFAYYGIAQLFINQDSLAFKSLSYAIKKNESNPLAYYGLGCYYAKKGKSSGYLKAYYCFERAFSLSQALTYQLTDVDISLMKKTFMQGFLKNEFWGELYRLDYDLEKELWAKENKESSN